MQLTFTKMQGLGNDFIVLDGIRENFALTADQVRTIADRRYGAGCDQVLLLQRGPGDGSIRFRIFNADGSEVGQCGNGARCAAEFLRQRGYANGESVTLRTVAGPLRVYARDGGSYQVDMGVPKFLPEEIPLRVPVRQSTYKVDLAGTEVEFAALSLGNPHAVILVEDIDAADVGRIGPAFQAHGIFPESVNVGFMEKVDTAHIRVRVYERGAGETMACGSGACAAVVVGRLSLGLEAQVEASLRGGDLSIHWGGEGEPVWMTGPAVTVYEGRMTL